MKNRKNPAATDRRTRYTRQTIRDSLLSIMKKKSFSKITVTEVCRMSEINRGTFYLHYYDLEDVLDDMIEDALQDTTPLLDHVMCPAQAKCTYPFCQKVQESQEFQILLFDEIASSKLLNKLCESSKESFTTHLMKNSLLTYEQAEAVLYFQMNGCLAINKRMLQNHCRDWTPIRQVIDQFIKSGLESYFIQDGRQS